MLKTLLEMGNLGQKTKAGFFKKVGRDVLRFELDSKEYVPACQKADEVYGRMLKKPAAERLKLLRNHAEAVVGEMKPPSLANMLGGNYIRVLKTALAGGEPIKAGA